MLQVNLGTSRIKIVINFEICKILHLTMTFTFTFKWVLDDFRSEYKITNIPTNLSEFALRF